MLTVYGQLILKWRIAIYGSLPDGFGAKIIFLLKALIDPFIFSGLFAAFLASLFWMAAMTIFDLSQAYPMIIGGLALVTTLAAFVLLKEDITTYKIAGLVVILSGLYLISQ